MKRFLILLCAALLLLGTTPLDLAVSAAGAEVAQKKAELESKYGISIQYSADSVTVNSLITLDMALENVTPAIVRQVSEYYRNKIGSRLTISYRRESSNQQMEGWSDLAGFDPAQALIALYLPGGADDSVVITGENPITIIHEFGHALHLMLCDLHGYDRMYQEWSSYNNGIPYSQNYGVNSPDSSVFLSGYASSMFEEDAAILLGNALGRGKAGLGLGKSLASNGNYTGIGMKLIYWQNLIRQYLTDADQIIANLNKAFTAPSGITWQGQVLGGEYLQYMGYPQPRYILNGTLKVLGRQSEHALWIRAIGGWYVRDARGDEIIVFPGGVWCDAPAGLPVSQAS